MKEYIERAKVLESLGYEENRRGDVLPGSTFDIILKEPAADVVEVIRCRECAKKTGGALGGYFWCGGKVVKPDDGCPYGVRMDKEDENEVS